MVLDIFALVVIAVTIAAAIAIAVKLGPLHAVWPGKAANLTKIQTRSITSHNRDWRVVMNTVMNRAVLIIMVRHANVCTVFGKGRSAIQ